MRRKIKDALPGFVGLREFFKGLPKKFEPVLVGQSEKSRMIAAIGQIRGFPPDCVDAAKRAWMESAHVREVRRFATGETMVRFEVRRRCEVVKSGPFEERPYMLMMLLGTAGALKQYTLMYGTGRLEGGARFKVSADGRIVEDWDQLLQFVEEMGDGDFFIVEDKLHPRQFFQGCCHIDNEGRWFQLEYAIHDWTWQFSKTIHPYEEGCKRLIMRFKNGGFPAIQETCSWRQMYIKESDLSRSGLRYPDGNPR